MSEYLKSRMQQILAGRPLKTKEKKPISKVSAKRQAKLDEQKKQGSDSEMDLFFTAMLKRCTGRCLFCNQKTTAIDPNFWRDDNSKWSQEANDKAHERKIESLRRASVAHLLEKRNFKSVATNEDNWIELCWSCHTSFDNGKISWLMLKDSKEWDVIKEKLLSVLPMVAQEERKHKLYSKLNHLVYGK